MKTLYISCAMGAAGDMLTAALLELMPDQEAVLAELNALGLPGVRYEAEKSAKLGIAGTQMRVFVDGIEEGAALSAHAGHDHAPARDHTHEEAHAYGADHAHDHSHGHHHGDDHDDDHCDHHRPHHGINLRDIMDIVRDLNVPEDVRSNIVTVFSTLADAESHVHGQSVSQIHLHEVGTLDAIADIAGFCLLLSKLKPDQVIVSPIHVGSGTVRCAHGILPVPAPATAYLLKDVPIYSREDISGELCTPTGAALLTHFAGDFGAMPLMTTRAIGCGLGKKDFSSPNCVRAFWGESPDEADKKDAGQNTDNLRDTIIELTCNLDDMTAEAIGFALDRLYEAGAAEAFTTPCGMKKNRPGTLLTALVRKENEENVAAALFRHTTTIGIRRAEKERYILARKTETIDTPYGPIRKKTAEGYGVSRSKFEYDDLQAAAARSGKTLEEIIADI